MPRLIPTPPVMPAVDVIIEGPLSNATTVSDLESVLSDLDAAITGVGAVTSVAGKTGVVSLVKADITDLLDHYSTILFEAAGTYVASTQVGGRRYNRFGTTITITDVTMHRETPGTSGSTTIDLNVNGVTAYTTQSNRPTVLFSEGTDAIDQGDALPDTISISDGSYITIDIDEVEGGAPENITVVVTVKY